MDHHQASEQFWGATAVMVKAIAGKRGWPHHGHRELHRAISRLSQETGSRKLIRLFGSPGYLHTNFFEDWLPADQVEELAAPVRELVSEVGRILET